MSEPWNYPKQLTKLDLKIELLVNTWVNRDCWNERYNYRKRRVVDVEESDVGQTLTYQLLLPCFVNNLVSIDTNCCCKLSSSKKGDSTEVAFVLHTQLP